ncbi:MAG TPA: aspartyl protease family protein [Phenylobacterium sp.]|uniref:aspartyl protease family protein n=1 Tax=Phenylobacterium sp. TaxID=1871053 RepID=UPI002C3B36CB|nr:aspartyl protease family protein [Phenylobacterium sp.]HSV04399.1 aspartyl protease family protein [Phenylobacterium sp.]
MSGRGILLAFAVTALAAQGNAALAAAKCDIGKVAELPTTMVGLRAHVTVKVDGQDTTFTVDSGAAVSFINTETAQRMKLEMYPAPIGYYAKGAGGTDMRLNIVRVSLGIDGIKIPNVVFLALPSVDPGSGGVIGQNVLAAMDTEYDLGNGVIRLMHPSADCEQANLAYWSGGRAVGVVELNAIGPQSPHLRAEAKLNGQTLHVIFDTGAPVSYVKLAAAEKAGFRPEAAGVQASGPTTGIGGRVMESWVAPFDSLDIGGEQIQHTRLRVANLSLDGSDMLLGADFFLSHRIYYSKQQRRLYFTYNGGPVFQLGRPSVALTQAGTPAPAPAAAAQYADVPTDAAGFARRGEASMSRHDYSGALADFTRATELDPKDAEYFRHRAEAHLGLHNGVLAMADFDEVLKLDPSDVRAHMQRAVLYLAAGDEHRAADDFAAAIKAEPDRELIAASLYSASGRFEPAIVHYDAWIAGHPKSERMVDALNGRCWARSLWGHDLDKALADCEAAVRRGPHVAALFDSRGLAHLRRGELDLALADYNEALKLQPKSAWSLYGRGLAKLQKGDKPGGEADIAAAAAIAPNLSAQAKRYGLSAPGTPLKTAG